MLVGDVMISHARNGEDVVLRRAFEGRDPGFYVDVGAGHPADESVTRYFYERGWRGINIEADEALFDRLASARPRDLNVRATVSASEGDAALVDVLGTHLPGDREIAFLKIGAQVVASMDWRRHRPLVVLVDAVQADGASSHAAWEGELFAADYRFALFDGLNRFYCRAEDADWLLPRLAVPANVTDNWRRHADIGAPETFARAEARALQSEHHVETLKAQLAQALEAAAAARRREAIVEELLAEIELREQVKAEAAVVRARQMAGKSFRSFLGQSIGNIFKNSRS